MAVTASTIAKMAREVRAENARRDAWETKLREDHERAGKTYDPKRDYMQDDDAAAELAVAIVKAAASHYEGILMSLLEDPGEKEKKKLMMGKDDDERFFLGQNFEVLMPHTDGRAFMKQIQKNAVEKAKQKARERLEKARSNDGRQMRKG